VLFEMLTGRTPFEGDLAALSYAHTQTPAPRVRSIDPSVPAAMDDLVAAMLEKDPARRPPTGEEVERSLAAAFRPDAVAPTASTERMQPPPSTTPRPPAGGRRRPRPKTRPLVVIAVCGLAVLFSIALLASREPDGRTDASQRSPQLSSSPATQQPSPVETPTPQQSSPTETSPQAPEQPSPQEAAAVVLATVGDGIETGEITDHFDHEIRHTIDEILRDTDKGEDVDGLLEKVDDLREKVSEALEKGEITSADRASAIDEALLMFAEALRDAEQ
jgi:serine/threonine-protein kinase